MSIGGSPERGLRISILEERVNPLQITDSDAYRLDRQREWERQRFTWVDQGLWNGAPHPDGVRKFTLMIAGQQSVLEVVDPTADGTISTDELPMLWTWAAPAISLGVFDNATVAMDAAVALYEAGEYAGVNF